MIQSNGSHFKSLETFANVDIFDCYNLRGATDIWWVGARDAAKDLKMHRTVTATEKCSD